MRRRVAIVLGAVVVLELTTWIAIGRQRLVQSVPEMASKDFQSYEAHERKFRFPINPPMRLAVCKPTRASLGASGVKRLGEAVYRFNVTVVPEDQAKRMDPQLCYQPKWQTPFLAATETSLGPRFFALASNGFEHYYFHIGGTWLHLYSRMAWVS